MRAATVTATLLVPAVTVVLAACGPSDPPPAPAPPGPSPAAAASPALPTAPVPTAAPTPAATGGVAAPAVLCDGTPPVAARSGQDFTLVQNDLGLEIVQDGVQQRIILPNEVLFDFDRDELRPEAPPTLEKVRQYLLTQDALLTAVWGHADGRGTDADNALLSQRRALAVATWMNEAGGAGYVNSLGKGETEPLCAETNPDGSDNPLNRQRNRRIEVVVFLRPPLPTR